jgi:exoribonuclease II
MPRPNTLCEAHSSVRSQQWGLANADVLRQEAAAAVLRTPPPDADVGTRLDLSLHRAVTIDDVGTREIDDGLSVERLPNGDVRMWVHIADPSRWVAPGDELDVHARFATRTLYQPTGAPAAECCTDNISCSSLHLDIPSAPLKWRRVTAAAWAGNKPALAAAKRS